MSKIILAGGPKSGKSTLGRKLSAELGIPLVSTDDYIECGWSEAPHEIILKIKDMPSYILEGVNSGRTIRKMAEKDMKLDFDRVIYLDEPRIELNKGQAALRKGCVTVWQDVRKLLDEAGIDVEYGVDL